MARVSNRSGKLASQTPFPFVYIHTRTWFTLHSSQSEVMKGLGWLRPVPHEEPLQLLVLLLLLLLLLAPAAGLGPSPPRCCC